MTLTDVRSAFELSEDLHALTDHRDAWDRLAMISPSPFLTHAWLAPWARSSRQRLLCATVKGPGGELRAGALLRRIPGGLASGAEDFGGDWDVVAVDEAARRALWEGIVSLKPPRLHLAQLRVDSPETLIASDVLRRSGYGILPSVRTEACPYVALPATFEELLAGRSSGTRQDVRRRRRKLERAGRVRFRTTTGGPNLDRDWKKFLTVEASGWKGQTKSAIITRPSAKTLYDDFVHEAAERGWLRLGLLELDGSVIAGQLAIFLGGEGFGLKMGFDESYRDLGPGSVIIAETFREAIEEGLRGMDLLGRRSLQDALDRPGPTAAAPARGPRYAGKGRRARLEIAAPSAAGRAPRPGPRRPPAPPAAGTPPAGSAEDRRTRRPPRRRDEGRPAMTSGVAGRPLSITCVGAGRPGCSSPSSRGPAGTR